MVDSLNTTFVCDFVDMTRIEREAYEQGFTCIAGVDEVGRGPLAGPVVAAACILPIGRSFPGINDSKKLTAKQRAILRDELLNDPDVHYGMGVVSEKVIDEINILEATKEAMKQAIDNLPIRPDLLLVDGLQLKTMIPCQGIIKGDAKSVSIAAASILAKEYRDSIMRQLHLVYPEYGFDRHKGYGTAQHLKALTRFGPCDCHRKSFSPVKQIKDSI